MTFEEFNRQLSGGEPSGYVSTDSPAKTPPVVLGPNMQESDVLIPRTAQEVNKQTTSYIESQQASERGVPAVGLGKYIEANQRANVVLDVGAGDEGFGENKWARMMVARRELVTDQKAFLEQHFGAGKVRMDKAGTDWIVEVNDPKTGKPKDIKLNEEAITMGDVGALLASAAPEILGSIGGLQAGRALPLISKAKGKLGFLRDLIAGSLGAQTVGGLDEASLRESTGQPINGEEIAKRRAGNVPSDVLLGYLFAGGAKAAKGVLNFGKAPFSFARTDIQNEGLDAAARIKANSGGAIDLIYDPGEASGFAGLIQSRKYLESHAAGAAPQLKFKAEQQAKVQAFKDFLFDTTTSDEEAGKKLLQQLQTIRTGAETAVESEKSALAGRSEGAVRRLIGTGEELPTVTGEKVRSEILTKAASIKSQNTSNYEKVYELPEATQPTIPTSSLEKTLSSIKERLPDREKAIEQIFYDQYGNPMTKTIQGRELLPGWTHDELKRFLAGGFDEKMPLNKMVEMRDLLYDKISQGEALQGIPNRYLKEMGASITKAIDEGVTALPSGELKARLTKANAYYKNDVLKLQEAGIEDLFATSREGTSFVEPQNVINRLKSDPAKYKRTLELIGTKSAGAEAIRQSIRTDLLLESTTGLDAKTIDGAKLLKNLNALRTGKNTREIFDDVFGGSVTELQKEGVLLGAAQGGIPIEEAKKWLSSNHPSITSLNRILKAEEDKAKLLTNQLVKDATSGKLDTVDVNPEEFVRKFYTDATQSELEQVMRWVRTDPALLQDIERKTIEQLFLKAGPKAKASDFEKLLSDPKFSKKFDTVVGPDNRALIDDFIKYERPREHAAEVAGGTGMLVKGSAIGKFIKALPLVGEGTVNVSGEIEEVIKIKALSYALAHPKIRKWLSSTKDPIEFSDLAKAVVVSTPFLESVAQDYPDNISSKIVNAVKEMTKPSSTKPSEPAAMPREDFEKQLR